MPGPGQGKRSHKKKWCENVFNTNANITAVNAVSTAMSTLAPSTTTIDAIEASKATRTDTATATSSTDDINSELQPFTYSHEEVRILLGEAKLDGY